MIVRTTPMTEMPANCRECYFALTGECTICNKAGKPEIKKSCMNKRHKDCPLIEIKV